MPAEDAVTEGHVAACLCFHFNRSFAYSGHLAEGNDKMLCLRVNIKPVALGSE